MEPWAPELADKNRSDETSQGWPWQGANRWPVAGGDGDDGQVDRRAIGDGHGGLCEPPVVSLAQGNAGAKSSVNNTKNPVSMQKTFRKPHTQPAKKNQNRIQ
jgi:hypothetical protein